MRKIETKEWSDKMSKVDELLKQLGELDKQTGFQARKLETDEHGNLLLDPKNPEDVEWYENDAAYDIVPNEFLIDSHGNLISKDKNTNVIY